MRRRMLMQMGGVISSADIVFEVGENNLTSFRMNTKDSSQYEMTYTDADGILHTEIGESYTDYHLSTQPYSTILFNNKQVASINVDHNNVIRVILNNYDALTNVYGRRNTVLAEVVNYENINATSIGQFTFQNCSNLTLSELPSGVTSIGNYAFSGCAKITLSELPSGVTSIGNYAFSGCAKITLSELPSGVTSIGDSAFQNCSNLTLSELPSGVTSIGNNAFEHCSNLALSELPSSVTSIGNNAFYNCSNLALSELPSSVTSIGRTAFYRCAKITDVKILNTSQMITSAASMFPTGITIRVPNALLSQYQADANWSTYNLIGY